MRLLACIRRLLPLVVLLPSLIVIPEAAATPEGTLMSGKLKLP